MNKYMINVFVPNNLDGSVAAVQAHLAAKEKHGAVQVVHCSFDEQEQKIGRLLHDVTVADDMNIKRPDHREIWISGFDEELSPMLMDELWFFYDKDRKNRAVYMRPNAEQTFSNCARKYDALNWKATYKLIKGLRQKDRDITILYGLLDPEDFECLVSSYLWDEPDSCFMPGNVYPLSLFIEHAKKK